MHRVVSGGPDDGDAVDPEFPVGIFYFVRCVPDFALNANCSWELALNPNQIWMALATLIDPTRLGFLCATRCE